ncbi:MAG: hypothetical protein ABIJ96_04395 [Elusimicrobiota bacterium]
MQNNWQSGAGAGSTTTAATGWPGYDSAQGDIVITGGLPELKQTIGRTWLQTDEGTGVTGFNLPGRTHSTTTVTGTGAAAELTMLAGDSVAPRAMSLLQTRGDIVAVNEPGTGYIWLLGGRNSDGSASRDIHRYEGRTDTISSAFPNLKGYVGEAAGAYHAPFNTIFVIGGSSETTALESIFSYTPSINSSIKRNEVLPSSRALAAAAYVPYSPTPNNSRIYIFGGIDENGTLLDQIVEYIPAIGTVANFAPATLPTPRYGMTAVLQPGTTKVFLFGGTDAGGDLDTILAFDPIAGTVTPMTSVLPAPRRKVSAVYSTEDHKIHLFGGVAATAYDDIMVFDPVVDTLTVRPITLPSARAGMAVAQDTETLRIYGFGASSGTPGDFDQIIEYIAYTSAAYISSVFDTGNLSDLGTISWSPAAPFGPLVGLDIGVRAGNTQVPDGTWTNSGASATVTNGASLAAFGDQRYVQYIASFTRTDISTTAVLEDLAITYTQTAASSTLVSSAFDSGSHANVLQAIRWEAVLPGNTTVQFQIRTASDDGSGFPATYTSWLGPTGTGDYFTDAAGGDGIHPTHRDGKDDRFFQYRTVLYSTSTFSTPALTSVTIQYNILPSSPSLDSLTALSTTQIEVKLTDKSTSEDEFPISYGPTALLVVGVSTIATSDKAGTGGQETGLITGLSPNQLIFVSVLAHVAAPDDMFSSTDTGTNGSVFTLANPPDSPAITGVYLSSLTLAWGKNDNANNTPYEISISTDDFATIVSTPVVFTDNWTQTTTDVLALELGTTYYARVRARNGNAFISSFSATVSTHTRPPPLTGLTITDIGITSMSWSWNSGGPAVQYRVYNPTANVVVATISATNYTGTILATNTVNSIYVEPFNSHGSGGLSAHASTYTFAAAPAGLNATFTSSTTINLTWDRANNPIGTPYELLRSTDDFATDISTPLPFSANFISSFTSQGNLEAGTTYWFKIRAKSAAEYLTLFAAPLSTPTHPSRLAAPTTSQVGITSITWNWINTGGPAVDRYDLYIASGTGALNDRSAVIAATTTTTLVETGLGPSSRHVLQVAPVTNSGVGVLSPATTIYTQANPPANSQITGVFVSSITMAWSTSQNSDFLTTYEVEHSTDAAQYIAFTSYTLAGSASTKTISAFSLLGLTTHYFRVRALNFENIPTSFDVVVSTFLVGSAPEPPGGLRAEPLSGARVLLEWSISPTTTVVRYSIYSDGGTGTVDYGVLFASVTSPTTSYTTGALADGTTYLFALRARDETGLEEVNTSVVASVVALTAPFPAAAHITHPPNTAKVSGDRVGIVAELAQGSPAQVSRVLFQYRLVGAPNWTDITPQEAGHPNPATEFPYAVHWDVTALPDNAYDLRAVARDAGGGDDPFPTPIRLFVNTSDPDVDERVVGGSIQQRTRVRNTVPIETTLADAGSAVLTRITIASGALNTDSTYLQIISSPTVTPALPWTLGNPGIFREITLANGQTDLAAGRTAALRFSRLDRDNDNRVDGTTVRVDNLAIYVYDAASASWKRDFPSGVAGDDYSTVIGYTPHFSLFGLFSPSAGDLSAVRVYPVPYKPNGGNPDEGKPYSAGDSTSGILFDNLTPSSKIKIYTVNGSLVWESRLISAGGIYRWDARNGDSREVASGIYFAVITSDGENAIVRKIAIIR